MNDFAQNIHAAGVAALMHRKLLALYDLLDAACVKRLEQMSAEQLPTPWMQQYRRPWNQLPWFI